MEILRDYQIAKQLGLIKASRSGESGDDPVMAARIKEAYRASFSARVTGRSSPASPRNSGIRDHVSPVPAGDSQPSAGVESGDYFSLLARVAELERDNAETLDQLAVTKSELEIARKKIVDLMCDRDQLTAQLSNLKHIASSESGAERVLERVSPGDSPHLEMKLEIYRQQIRMLTDELEKLKT